MAEAIARPGSVIGRALRQRARDWGRALLLHEERLFLILTLLVGALVSLTVIAFMLVSELIGSYLYPVRSPDWRRLIVPVAGSLLTGILLSQYFPEARGSGIPQTKAAMFFKDGRILLRTVLGRFVCSAMALASGIALGREGPSVQIGGGIASIVGRRLGIGPERLRALIPVGAAAAVAAAFNTPIAAVLFALEELLEDLHAPVLGSVVLSAATSWLVLHAVLGDELLFEVPRYQLVSPAEFAIYAVLGLLCGLVSVAFVKLTIALRKEFLGRSHRWAHPVLGGLAVGLMALWVPEVMGVGYNYVDQVLNGEIVIRTVALLIILKLLATSICFGSGNSGGIFGPSLFLGAMTGATVGTVAHKLFPGVTGPPGAYALVGMGAVFAGIIRTPFTSVFMIFELTRTYPILVPLMIANLTSFGVSHRLQQTPIYAAILEQDGMPRHHGQADLTTSNT